MGVDLDISFTWAGPQAELNDFAYDFARRIGPDWFYEHPCLDERNGRQIVKTWSRWFGPGYERGNWPKIRAAVTFLNQHPKVIDLVAQPDTFMDDDIEPTDIAGFIAQGDEVFYRGHWDYRWSRGLTSGVDVTPTDAYGKPMICYGGSGSGAFFYSPATGEKTEIPR